MQFRIAIGWVQRDRGLEFTIRWLSESQTLIGPSQPIVGFGISRVNLNCILELDNCVFILGRRVVLLAFGQILRLANVGVSGTSQRQ